MEKVFDAAKTAAKPTTKPAGAGANRLDQRVARAPILASVAGGWVALANSVFATSSSGGA